MRVVRRVIGTAAILFMLTGCTVGTHSAVAIPKLPACDVTFARLAEPRVANESGGRIPDARPGPMRLCRYRWINAESKLMLVADITLPLAPVVLMHALSQLKTIVEVYGRNAVFPCPTSQGNADVVIIRAATGSDLTVIEVNRDGCGFASVTHAGFSSYIRYLGSTTLNAQVDAMITTSVGKIKTVPTIHVTPSINLRSGQQVLVQVRGAIPGERFRVSECASAAAANINGCGDQLAAQAFVDTDASGAGSITFDVKAWAATKPYNTTAFQPCTDKCVIMATGGFEGTSTLVYASLKFAK